jgi:hypothetical protein
MDRSAPPGYDFVCLQVVGMRNSCISNVDLKTLVSVTNVPWGYLARMVGPEASRASTV